MHITRCDARLTRRISQCQNASVYIFKRFLGIVPRRHLDFGFRNLVFDIRRSEFKRVVAEGLYFEIVIKIDYLLYALLRLTVFNRAVEFTALTCGTEYKALSVLYEIGLECNRLIKEMLRMGI